MPDDGPGPSGSALADLAFASFASAFGWARAARQPALLVGHPTGHFVAVLAGAVLCILRRIRLIEPGLHLRRQFRRLGYHVVSVMGLCGLAFCDGAGHGTMPKVGHAGSLAQPKHPNEQV